MRDWCRFGADATYIEPGSLGEPLGRVLRRCLRDELLAIEQFDTLLEAHVLVADWRIESNTCRQHVDGGQSALMDYVVQWLLCNPSTTRFA
jgi:putative transposase